MERYHFFAFLLCGVFMSRVLSVPLTSFSLDCESMLPDLPVKPQESESPYHVSVPTEEYDPGSEVKVNVEGTGDAGFKWFMLQARDFEGNIPVGSFQITDPNTQGLDCYNMTNSALIHMGPDEKRNVSALWVSPEAKTVQFVATIFQDPETYWVTVPSIVVFPRDSNETADESESGDESKPADGSSRSRKKSSSIIVRVHCGPGGTGSSSECAKSSSQGGSSQPQGGIVYQGGVKKGCIGGGTAGVYNKYGCTDPGIGSGSSSYGQSVSVTSDSKGKTIQYAPSKPYPPDRTSYTSQLANSKYKHIQSTQYANKVQTQGSSPQGGIRITIQSGQPGQVCDKTSSSYNTQACKTSIQSSTSQSGGSYGSQGGSTTKFGGSGASTTFGSSGTSISVSDSGASTSVSVGGSGSSTSRGGSCGQGYTFDGNSCKQSGSSQQTYGTTQGGSSQQNYGTSQGGSSQQNYGSSQGGSSQQNYGSSQGGSSQQNYGSSQGGSSQQNYGSSQGGSSQQNYGSSQGGSSQQNYGSSQGGSSQQTYGTSQGGSSQQTYGANQGGSYTQGSRNPCGGSYSGKILSSSNCPQRGPSQYGAGNRPGYQGGQIYGQGSGSQNYGGYSSNNCDRGGVSGGKALSSANCRGKRDVAAVQDAFNTFIRKIQEKKATSHPQMRKIRKIRSEKNETSNSRSFTPNAQGESISSSENHYDHDGSFMYINEVADCFCPGAQGGRGGVPVGGSSNQYGQAGRGGSYGGSRPYGQVGPYGGGGSQYGQSGQSGSYGGSSQYGQGGQSGTYGGGSQYGQGGSYGGGSQYGQGGQSGSYGGGNQYGQGGQSGSYGGGNQYGQGGSYGGGSYGGGSSQYGQGGQSGSYGSSQYGQGGQSGSYGSSQYGQGGQSGSYGSSQYGQGGQSGSYGGGNQYGQGGSYGGSSSGTSGTSSSQYGQNSSSSGGNRPGGKNSTSSGGSPTSGQGSPYSGGRPSSGQGGCFCPGGIPGTPYAGSNQYGQGPSGGQYGGSSQYGGGQGSQYGSSNQYGGGRGSQYGSGSQYGGGRGSQYGSGSQYGGGQGSQYGSGSQYGGGRGSQYGSGSQYGGGRGSQYGGQGYYPYGSSQYGSGRGGQHGPSSAGKQSTSSLTLISVLSAFAVCSSVVSKWLI